MVYIGQQRKLVCLQQLCADTSGALGHLIPWLLAKNKYIKIEKTLFCLIIVS